MGAPTDKAVTRATTLYLPKSDPLVLALCASMGPRAWVVSVDPTLEELAASLVVSQQVEAIMPGCSPPQAAAPQEVEA